MTSRARRESGPLWLPLAMSALLSLPYLVAIRSFFVSDDWVYLSYYGSIPPWQIWRYFSPRVIWFYRPLQALQFGWLYHAVGLQPLAYNLCLWIMHVGVCLLVYVLASHLTSGRAALLTTALFATAWTYVDVLQWSSNFSTLQWALVTLGLCIVFLRYLESRRPALLTGVYVLFLLNFCAKETAVNAPLLLAALWWWQTSGKTSWTRTRSRIRAQASGRASSWRAGSSSWGRSRPRASNRHSWSSGAITPQKHTPVSPIRRAPPAQRPSSIIELVRFYVVDQPRACRSRGHDPQRRLPSSAYPDSAAVANRRLGQGKRLLLSTLSTNSFRPL